MLKGFAIVALGLIGIYLLIDYDVINLGQAENLGSSVLDWIIDQYQKAKDVVFGETA